MRINSVTIKNFGAIGEGRVDFDALPSLVMVAGRLRSAGASSNGAGKSTLFNAMTWGLFGREMKKRATVRVIRRGEKRATVTVKLTLDDGTVMTVERSRVRSGAAELLVDGKPFDTNTGAQEALERRLGFTYEQFTRTVVFGGDLSSFCRMTPADRTRMLEELLGISHYLDASTRARESLVAVQQELTTLIGLRESGRESIRTLRTDVQSLIALRHKAEREYDAVMEVRLSDIAAASLKAERLSRKLGEARRSAVGEIDEFNKKMAAWKKRLREAQEAVENADTQRSKALADVHAVEGEIETATRMLKSLRQRDRDRVCPTCHRPLEGNSQPIDFKPHEDELARLNAVREKRLAVVEKVKVSLKTARDAVADIEAQQPPTPRETELVSRLREEVAVVEDRLSALIDNYQEACGEEPGDEYNSRLAGAMKRLRGALEDIGRRDAKINELEHQQSVLAYWQKGMARDGIPAMLLESTAPLLNNAVKPLTDILTDGAYTIRFTGGVTRGKADFKVEASNIEGGESYEDLSKGELTRVDLCVLFAIRALMADRAALRPEQVFIDELADGLDEQGMMAFTRLLKSKRLAKQVVFISHDQFLQEAADAVVRVTKKNGVSSIDIQG